ncbi:hypothetical protein KA183_16780 [bacterium]|nr:hypothetical protein [bacterium]
MKNRSITLLILSSLTAVSLAVGGVQAKGVAKEVDHSASKEISGFTIVSETKSKDLKDVNGIEQVEGTANAKNIEVVDEPKGSNKPGFQLGDLNPIKWIFKPVTDMQEKVVHLEKQIVKLEGPISGLQKPMVDVRGNMVEVQGQLKGVSVDMASVDKRLGHVEKQLDRMYKPIVELKEPVQNLAEPIKSLKDQLNQILSAVLVVGVMICVGTPIVALFAFRYRVGIMKALGGQKSADKMEEDTGKAKPHEAIAQS